LALAIMLRSGPPSGLFDTFRLGIRIILRMVGKQIAIRLVALGWVIGAVLGCTGSDLTPTQRHGGELYIGMCAVCHGRLGEGYLADQAPAIGRPAFLGAVTDAFLREAIANGRVGSTMSAWSTVHGGPLLAKDVDAVIAFMRTWDQGKRVVLNEKKLAGNAERGAATYASECVRCHGMRGQGGPNVRIGNPALLATASDGFLRDAIRNGRPRTTMSGFRDRLGAQQLDDVVALLRSFQTVAPKAVPTPLAAQPPPPPLPLGPVPLNPKGPEPKGFRVFPKMTGADVVHAEMQRKARMAILDARAQSDYLADHIAGAVSVPFYDPSPYIKALPKNVWLVCYCACPHAESGALAQKLLDSGFKKVTVLDEGLGVWKQRGYGTSSGPTPGP
jgi:cytochrome c oxidase cbb3-type subunit 3/ubiquinol-cytochrome c reductase cytochrome c subunit